MTTEKDDNLPVPNLHTLDLETLAIMRRYAGADFATQRIGENEVIKEFEEEWSLDDFMRLMATAIAAIPPEYRASAIVHIGGDEYFPYLSICYTGPEPLDKVHDRIASAWAYAKKCQALERAQYEQLKQKFGT